MMLSQPLPKSALAYSVNRLKMDPIFEGYNSSCPRVSSDSPNLIRFQFCFVPSFRHHVDHIVLHCSEE
jgi:hypothetical protein